MSAFAYLPVGVGFATIVGGPIWLLASLVGVPIWTVTTTDLAIPLVVLVSATVVGVSSTLIGALLVAARNGGARA